MLHYIYAHWCCVYLGAGNAVLHIGSDRLHVVVLQSLFYSVAHPLSTGVQRRRKKEG